MYFKRQDICAEGRTIKEMKIKVYQIRNVYLDDDEEDFLKTAISFFFFSSFTFLQKIQTFLEKSLKKIVKAVSVSVFLAKTSFLNQKEIGRRKKRKIGIVVNYCSQKMDV